MTARGLHSRTPRAKPAGSRSRRSTWTSRAGTRAARTPSRSGATPHGDRGLDLDRVHRGARLGGQPHIGADHEFRRHPPGRPGLGGHRPGRRGDVRRLGAEDVQATGRGRSPAFFLRTRMFRRECGDRTSSPAPPPRRSCPMPARRCSIDSATSSAASPVLGRVRVRGHGFGARRDRPRRDPLSRSSVVAAYFDGTERDSVLGTYSITEEGETTSTALAPVPGQAEGGRPRTAATLANLQPDGCRRRKQDRRRLPRARRPDPARHSAPRGKRRISVSRLAEAYPMSSRPFKSTLQCSNGRGSSRSARRGPSSSSRPTPWLRRGTAALDELEEIWRGRIEQWPTLPDRRTQQRGTLMSITTSKRISTSHPHRHRRLRRPDQGLGALGGSGASTSAGGGHPPAGDIREADVSSGGEAAHFMTGPEGEKHLWLVAGERSRPAAPARTDATASPTSRKPER